jgi:hypothetical protein
MNFCFKFHVVFLYIPFTYYFSSSFFKSLRIWFSFFLSSLIPLFRFFLFVQLYFALSPMHWEELLCLVPYAVGLELLCLEPYAVGRVTLSCALCGGTRVLKFTINFSQRKCFWCRLLLSMSRPRHSPPHTPYLITNFHKSTGVGGKTIEFVH